MARATGRTVPLSVPRRFIADLMHAAARVPSVPMERRMPLGPLVAARAAAEPRVGWCTLFTKAFALVAARHAELRRAYMTLPVARLFEHTQSVAAVAVERDFDGEKCVLFGHIRAPEEWPLTRIDERLRFFKEAPFKRVRSFRRALRFTRWPQPLRRLAWWYGLNASGPARAKYLGTFGVSTTAGEGASQLYLWTPLTTALFYSPLAADGSLDVRLTFDHRVLDGCTAARVLGELERTLLGEILDEVRGLQRSQAA
jgi:hypothetical protein